MKRKLVWLVLIAFVLSVAAVAAYADRGHGPMWGFKGMGLFPMAEKLDLTDEQIETVKALRLDTQKKVVQLRAEAKVAELELRDLLDQASVDKKAVHQKIEAIGKLKTKIRILQVDQRIAIKGLLTPEQQEKARESLMGPREGHGRGLKQRPFRGREHGGDCPWAPKHEE